MRHRSNDIRGLLLCLQSGYAMGAAANECNPSSTCNVCPECCQDYIPDGSSCNKCVSERCPPWLFKSGKFGCSGDKTCQNCTLIQAESACSGSGGMYVYVNVDPRGGCKHSSADLTGDFSCCSNFLAQLIHPTASIAKLSRPALSSVFVSS